MIDIVWQSRLGYDDRVCEQLDQQRARRELFCHEHEMAAALVSFGLAPIVSRLELAAFVPAPFTFSQVKFQLMTATMIE